MRRRVVAGTLDVIATFSPQSALTRVDLPTFGRPATATKPLFTGLLEWGTPSHHPLRSYRRTTNAGDTALRRECTDCSTCSRGMELERLDRKSTRLNSSHEWSS